MQFSGFVEAANLSASAEQVFDLLCAETLPFGYHKIGFFALATNGSRTPAPIESPPLGCEPSPILISNYPEEFVHLYTRERRQEIDPLLAMVGTNLTPLVWEDVLGHMTLSKGQELLCQERLDAGLHDEVTCPIHGPSGQGFALRFARGQPGPCDRDHLSALQVLAIHFYYVFTKHRQEAATLSRKPAGMEDSPQMAMPEGPLLSRRERECMLWTARGKSASSISIILGLSENTVNFYVKNAMKKLGTTNRVVAVVLAVRSGLIQP